MDRHPYIPYTSHIYVPMPTDSPSSHSDDLPRIEGKITAVRCNIGALLGSHNNGRKKGKVDSDNGIINPSLSSLFVIRYSFFDEPDNAVDPEKKFFIKTPASQQEVRNPRRLVAF